MKKKMSGGKPRKKANTLTVSLVFEVGSKKESFSHQIQLPNSPTEGGTLNVANQTFAELEKEIHFSRFYDELPDPAALQEFVPRSFTPQEWYGEEHALLLNTQQVWHEITNTLLSAKYSLAQARAYKEVEIWLMNQGIDHRSPDVLNVHLSKMNAFDGAVYRLAKMEDLFLLLLFVNLGNSLVDANVDVRDWEKKLNWIAVRDGLRQRHPAAISNRYLNALSEEDYATIVAVFKKFKSAGEVGEITGYRDATTHRIPPAVDYHGFNAKLIFPKGQQTGATRQVTSLIRKYSVDFQFLDLYQKAAKVFSHYVQVLQDLKKVPRFA